MVHAAAVRAHAGVDARQLEHVGEVDDRDGGGDGVAVQVEVDDEGERGVGRDADGSGEAAEGEAVGQRVIGGSELPEPPVGRAVRDGHVVVSATRFDAQSVRAVDVGRHDADGDVFFDDGAVGPEADEAHEVGRLVRDVDVVVRSRRGRALTHCEAGGGKGQGERHGNVSVQETLLLMSTTAGTGLCGIAVTGRRRGSSRFTVRGAGDRVDGPVVPGRSRVTLRRTPAASP